MPHLDHVNITVVDGPRMARFLELVLDAREGFRPPFDFPEGIVNHVAFGVYEFQAAKARVEASGYPWKLAGLPGTPIGQIFVIGPEGLLVEIQYRR